MTLLKRNESKVPSFPSVFDNWFNRDLMDWMNWNFSETNTTVPAVNVRETESEFNIEVAVPGLNKEDFKINLEQDVLTISSEKKRKVSIRAKSLAISHSNEAFHSPKKWSILIKLLLITTRESCTSASPNARNRKRNLHELLKFNKLDECNYKSCRNGRLLLF